MSQEARSVPWLTSPIPLLRLPPMMQSFTIARPPNSSSPPSSHRRMSDWERRNQAPVRTMIPMACESWMATDDTCADELGCKLSATYLCEINLQLRISTLEPTTDTPAQVAHQVPWESKSTSTFS